MNSQTSAFLQNKRTPLPISASSQISFKGETYSYSDLERLAELFEDQLLPYVGLYPRVAWVGKNHPAAVALYFACLRLNLWFVCARSIESYTLENLRQDQNVLQFSDNGLTLQVFQYSKSAAPLKPQATGLILPSSGTSGLAKFCRIPFSVSSQNADSAAQILDLKNKDAAVVWSSFESTAGWNTLLLPSLLVGTPVHLHEEFSAYAALDVLAKLKNSVFHLSPLQAQLLTTVSGWKTLESHNNVCIIGSTDVPPRIIRTFCAKNITVLRNYGLTEAGPFVFSKYTRPDDILVDDLFELGDLTDGFEHRLRPFQNSKNCFHLDLRGPAVFSGYLNGSSVSNDDWFETGDLVSKLNNKFYFQCRASDVFKIGGETIFPNTVENFIIESCPDVRECLVSKIKGQLHLAISPMTADLTTVTDAVSKFFKDSGLSMRATLVYRLQRNSAGKSLRNH